MKLLVTGGAGFIGSGYVRSRLSRYPYDELIVLDALTYAGNEANLQKVYGQSRVRVVQGDIGDIALVERLFSLGLDAIIHFAAETHVDRSIADASVFVRTNVLGTQVLLEAARRHRVSKLVHISTDEVYGTLGVSGVFSEQSPLAPNSPYAASKAGSDLLVRAYYETYGLPVCITRCSNNYGPYQHPEKLIPLAITRALRDESIPVYGDGLNIRDWLYVEDHCLAIDRVLEAGRPGEVYNVGGSNERTNLEVVQSILRLLGKPDSLLTFVPDRLGHDRRYAIDDEKLQIELGWKPVTDFQSGLRKTVEWYERHRSWWEPLVM